MNVEFEASSCNNCKITYPLKVSMNFCYDFLSCFNAFTIFLIFFFYFFIMIRKEILIINLPIITNIKFPSFQEKVIVTRTNVAHAWEEKW